MRWLMVWPDSHTINSFLLFPAASLLFAFVTETHPSHLKATVFSLVSIHLSLFFLFALLLRLSSDPCIHLVSSQPSLSLPLSLHPSPIRRPSPTTTPVFPKSSAITHLQWINYTVLCRLDWASNIHSPPPLAPGAPSSPPPTYSPRCFLLALFSSR